MTKDEYKQLYEQVCEQYDILAKELDALAESRREVAALKAVQEPVVFYRCNGCGHAYEQVHPTSCDCMEAGGFDRVEYYTNPPAAQPAPVQEPVAWMYEDMMGVVGVRVQKEKPIVARPVTPLYTTPPAAQPAPVPLTPDQRKNLWVSATIELPSQENCYYRGLVDAEAYHGITAAPEKGQP